MEKKYLTVDDVAERLQINPRTVRLWVKTKNLPVIKIGSIIRFDVEAVDNWVKQQADKK